MPPDEDPTLASSAGPWRSGPIGVGSTQLIRATAAPMSNAKDRRAGVTDTHSFIWEPRASTSDRVPRIAGSVPRCGLWTCSLICQDLRVGTAPPVAGGRVILLLRWVGTTRTARPRRSADAAGGAARCGAV